MQKFLIRLLVVLYFVTFAAGFAYLSINIHDITPSEIYVVNSGDEFQLGRNGLKYYLTTSRGETYYISRKQYKMAADLILSECSNIDDAEAAGKKYPVVAVTYPILGKRYYYATTYMGHMYDVQRHGTRIWGLWLGELHPERQYDVFDEYDADYMGFSYADYAMECGGSYVDRGGMTYGYSNGAESLRLYDMFFSIDFDEPEPKEATVYYRQKNRVKQFSGKYEQRLGPEYIDNYIIVKSHDPIARKLMQLEIRKAILTKEELPVFRGAGKLCHVILLQSIETPLFALGMILVTRKRSVKNCKD